MLKSTNMDGTDRKYYSGEAQNYMVSRFDLNELNQFADSLKLMARIYARDPYGKRSIEAEKIFAVFHEIEWVIACKKQQIIDNQIKKLSGMATEKGFSPETEVFHKECNVWVRVNNRWEMDNGMVIIGLNITYNGHKDYYQTEFKTKKGVAQLPIWSEKKGWFILLSETENWKEETKQPKTEAKGNLFKRIIRRFKTPGK